MIGAEKKQQSSSNCSTYYKAAFRNGILQLLKVSIMSPRAGEKEIAALYGSLLQDEALDCNVL